MNSRTAIRLGSIKWLNCLERSLLTGLIGLVLLSLSAASLAAQQFELNGPMSFSMLQGGTSSLPQLLPIAAANNSNFLFTTAASTSSGGSWLAVKGGVLQTPTSLAISVNHSVAGTLNAGTYSGEVVISSYYGGISETVNVKLKIVSATQPSFANLPGGLSYALSPGGGAGSQVIQINNAGSGSLNWTLTANSYNSSTFLTVSSASGTAPSLVTIGISPQNLPGGGLTAGTLKLLPRRSPLGSRCCRLITHLGSRSIW